MRQPTDVSDDTVCEGGLEALFGRLAEHVRNRRSPDEAEAQVREFFSHSELAALGLAAARRVCPCCAPDLCQSALVDLLAKVRRGLRRGGALLGYRRSATGKHGFTGWLFRVFRNACADALRRQSRHERRRAPSAMLESAVVRDRGDAWATLAFRLPQLVRSTPVLGAAERGVLLDLLAGKSAQQIAAAQNRAASWVTCMKQRGIARLRQLLEDGLEL